MRSCLVEISYLLYLNLLFRTILLVDADAICLHVEDPVGISEVDQALSKIHVI